MSGDFRASFEYKLIYIFRIDDDAHKGLLKIGDTTVESNLPLDSLNPNCRELNQAAKARIKQYTNTAGIDAILLHTEIAVRMVQKNGEQVLKAFRDHDVHRVLINSGINKKKIKHSTSNEWFEVDLETAIKAIDAVKKNRSNLTGLATTRGYTQIIFRPEQEEAIKKTLKQFKSSNRMLWNAKMRFGKTLSALQVIKESKFDKTIIITHRPVVDDGWYEDFQKIFFDTEEYIYGSKGKGSTIEELLNSKKKFVYFASIQDLRGSTAVGGKFDKNDTIFNLDWDFVIVDEAHEGTTTALGDDVIKKIVKEDSDYETKFLALSGTPFNILKEFDDNIYTWDYVMEQRSKAQWDIEHFGDSNPYEDLPELKIYTYDLGKILNNASYVELEDKAFNFREFFRVWTGDVKADYRTMPATAHVGDFIHEDDIRSFLDLITKEDDDSHYPYSNDGYRDLFRHALWMVPGVKEAKALSKLMKQHPIFSTFDIVNVAGDGDEEERSDDALNKVRAAIKDAGDDGYTITISCGKLTTGVTVPEWTAVFMLAGSFSTAAANYLQTIFRVQSPCNKNGKIKTCCYVFDFAPDRTLKMVAESAALSTKAGKATDSDRAIMGEFLNYCPVISISGTQMKAYDTSNLLQQLKRAYAERAVRNGFDDGSLYNDELLRLDELELKKFNELKAIIGKSKASHKTDEIDINRQGFDDEEYQELEDLDKKKKKRQLTPEQEARRKELKEKTKNKRTAISILRGISIRIPLLIYGADVPFEDDVTIEQLPDLVDDKSWEEFMPKDVTKDLFKEFIKYYDPEVFVAAGRRIRNTVMSAENLEPVERIKKITELFNCFKNPDKETVLTPWRVVNMHMSDCLGGYDFWDEVHQSTIETPRFVERGEVTANLFKKDMVQILEINSKTGLYPLYVAFSVFMGKCSKFNEDELTLEKQQELWKETIEKNIFVICKTPMAKQITRRTLVGYKDIPINAHYFEDLINTMKNKPTLFENKVLRPNYWKKNGSGKMKFDAVVGNPPYQETLSGTSDRPIYHLFMDAAFNISDKVSFITPARFLFNAGKTPTKWNEKILHDKHFKVIWYKPDSSEVFPNVEIKGGVAVTYRDANQDFGEIGTFSVNDTVNSILKKIRNKKSIESLGSIVVLQSKFNLEKLYKDYPNYVNVIGSQGKEKRLTTSIFSQIDIFLDNKSSNSQVAILGLVNNVREIKYIEKEYIDLYGNIEKYKVILPKSNGTGEFGEALSTPIMGAPDFGFTQSFISFGSFNNPEEAEALLKYIKTKFARCMLSTLKVTQHNPTDTWLNVPLQDFTSNSDIDWSKTIPEIDKQLYAKYGLSDEEIAFVESMVKPME